MANKGINKKQSGKKNKSTTCKVPKEATEVIILNKPFTGGWLNNDNHLAHEIIDFLLDDHGNHYIYGLHAGTCPDNIWVGQASEKPISNKGAPLIRGRNEPLKRIEKEKCTATYLILTSAAERESGKDTFDILYVVKLAEKLHRMNAGKKNWKDNCVQTRELVRNLNIQYNGHYLDECYNGNPWDLVVTYRAAEMYRAKVPIPFQLNSTWRNKGYVWNKKFSKSKRVIRNIEYDDLKDIIENAIKDPALMEEFSPLRVIPKVFEDNEAFRNMPSGNDVFLDVISLQDNEQAFTNMLYAILSVGEGNMMKEFCSFLRDKGKLPTSPYVFDVDQWKNIEVHKELPSNENAKAGTEDTKGRMDICAEIFDNDGDNKKLIQRVVLENKIDSGLNGRDKEQMISQLNTYYKWGSGKDLENRPSRKKPLCMVVAPTYRIEELEWEIKEIDKKQTSQKNKMLRDEHSKYHLLTYGDVADFIDKFKAKIGKEIDPAFVDQFSRSFRAHSLEKKDDYAWRFFLETKKAFSPSPDPHDQM